MRRNRYSKPITNSRESGSISRIRLLLFCTVAVPPVLFVVLNGYLTILSAGELVFTYMLGSPVFIAFMVVYMGTPFVVLAMSLKRIRKYEESLSGEIGSNNSNTLKNAQTAVGHFSSALIGDLIFGSTVGPLIIAVEAELEGFRFFAALLAGPATILLAAILLFLTTVSLLERRAHYVPIERHFFSVKAKLVFGVVFTPLVIIFLFSSMVLMILEISTGGGEMMMRDRWTCADDSRPAATTRFVSSPIG